MANAQLLVFCKETEGCKGTLFPSGACKTCGKVDPKRWVPRTEFEETVKSLETGLASRVSLMELIAHRAKPSALADFFRPTTRWAAFKELLADETMQEAKKLSWITNLLAEGIPILAFMEAGFALQTLLEIAKSHHTLSRLHLKALVDSGKVSLKDLIAHEHTKEGLACLYQGARFPLCELVKAGANPQILLEIEGITAVMLYDAGVKDSELALNA